MLFAKRFLPILIFFVFCFIYIHNLSRSVYGGDVGDLVTSGYVFGVAHPPGYPLFTLLGYILSHSLNISTIAFRVGLISAVSSAIGIVFLYLTVQKLTKNIILSLLSSLILGVNYLYWFYAEIAEIFALNNMFLLLLFFLAISLYLEKKKIYFFLLAFFTGLSLTNHHTIILVFPSLLILITPFVYKLIQIDKKTVILATGLFFVGFCVYLYLPIASSFHPSMNWGNIHDLQSFLHHILRKDYGTFSAGLFSQPNTLQRWLIFQSYITQLVHQLTIPVCFFSLIGIGYLMKIKRLIGVSLLIGFLLSGPFFIIYAGFPLYSSFNIGVYERFFLMSAILYVLFFPFGILFFLNFLKPYFRKESLYAIQMIFFMIPLLLFYYNFPKTNLSNVSIGDTLAKDILSPLPKNSVLLLSGDTVLFNTLYGHLALHIRPDIKILNINGLDRDSYFVEMKNKYKKDNPSIKDEQKIASQTILKIFKERPIFSVQSFTLSKDSLWIPYGLTYKLIQKENKPSEKEFINMSKKIWKLLHIPIRNTNNVIYGSLTISEFPMIYSNALLTSGYYMFSEYKSNKIAETYFAKALYVDKTNPKVASVLGTYYYTVKNDCKKGENELRRGILLDPFEKLNYFMLYSIAQTCYKNTNMQKEIQSQYEKTFHSSFAQDVKKGT